MPPKLHGLPHTFPHRMVFVISFVLCLCACASVVNAVLAWNHVLWGFYFGTGFWCGGVILFAGMFGIVASFVRNMCSVKTYMIISIFGCLASLGMIALAAGGLDSESGFYDGNNRGIMMTHVIHAVYLGLGLLQLTLCVLSDGICIYYLFIETNAELYRVKNFKNSRNNIVRDSKNRTSSGSEAPLVGRNSSKRKQHQNNGENETTVKPSSSNNNVGNEPVEEEPIRFNTTKSLDREALRRLEHMTSPIRNPYIRSASFSTFGRGVSHGHDRVSLIVHPTDDNSSVAGTNVSHLTDDRFDENAYAQIPLFGPPLPIEDDDELPPYEFVDDRKFFKRVRKRGLKRPKSEEINLRSHPPRRANTTPANGKRKPEKRMRISYNRAQKLAGEVENTSEGNKGKQQRLSSVGDKSIGRSSVKGLSRSADLLLEEGPNNSKYYPDNYYINQNQGVAYRDFAHSSEMILVDREQVPLRHRRSNQTQSLRVNRDKRLDRRRKALSAELSSNKDQYVFYDDGSEFQFDGSNPNVYAGSKIMPTKFSLRRPMRPVSIPRAPVPVKPIVTVPSVHGKPPPKPPRTHSVTREDFVNEEREINYDVEVENLFASINELNEVNDVFSNEPFKIDTNLDNLEQTTSAALQSANDNTNAHNVLNETTAITTNVGSADKPYTNESTKTIESKPIAYVSSTKSVPLSPNVKLDSGPTVTMQPRSPEVKLNAGPVVTLQPKSPEVKLNSGPVLKFIPPKQLPKPIQIVNDQPANQGATVSSENGNTKSINTMTLPTSPIILRHPTSVVESVQTDPIPPIDTRDMSVQAFGTWRKENNKTTQIKLPETAKSDNNSNVIYAQVRKTTDPKSPVSPVSPTSDSSLSPTSPTSRMLKARRLLYSFTDKDINVFDPVSNGRETEEVVEVVDKHTVKFPVQTTHSVPKSPETNTTRAPDILQTKHQPPVTNNQETNHTIPLTNHRPISVSSNGAISNISVRSPPPLSPLERIQGSIKRETPTPSPTSPKSFEPKNKTSDPGNKGTGSAISNITIRSTPMSASERILQRKAIKSDSLNDHTDRPVILQPIMKSPSRHSYGARPKTTNKYEGLFAPPVAPKPKEKPISAQPFDHKHNADNKRIFNFDKPSTSSTTTTATSNSASMKPLSHVSNSVQSKPSHIPLPIASTVTSSMTTHAPSSSSTTTMPLTASSRNTKTEPNNVLLPTPTATVSVSREVPVNRVQATPAVTTRSSNSQGVQHLPQSHYSRNVSDESPRPVLARELPQAAALPPHAPRNANVVAGQNNDDDSANKPLFSVVL